MSRACGDVSIHCIPYTLPLTMHMDTLVLTMSNMMMAIVYWTWHDQKVHHCWSHSHTGHKVEHIQTELVPFSKEACFTRLPDKHTLAAEDTTGSSQSQLQRIVSSRKPCEGHRCMPQTTSDTTCAIRDIEASQFHHDSVYCIAMLRTLLACSS